MQGAENKPRLHPMRALVSPHSLANPIESGEVFRGRGWALTQCLVWQLLHKRNPALDEGAGWSSVPELCTGSGLEQEWGLQDRSEGHWQSFAGKPRAGIAEGAGADQK